MDRPKLLELRPERNLLHPHFDGYKLSLEPLSKIKKPLTVVPNRRYASEDQYSFLHAQLFGMHNHLIKDPWTSGTYYYVDANGSVQTFQYNENTGALEQPVCVLAGDSDTLRPSNAGDYNFTLVFVSEKLCVLGDGTGGLSLCQTGDRYDRKPWTVLHTEKVSAEDCGGWVVVEARQELVEGRKHIHCILLHVQRENDGFISVLDWVVIEQQQNSAAKWTIRPEKRLRGKCLPVYCAFEAKCGALLVAGDQSFTVDGAITEDTASANAADEDVSFGWSQSDEEIIVRFDIAKGAESADFKVITDAQHVNVAHKGHNLLDAVLFAGINAGLTTWLLENETLTLTMIKAKVDKEWPSLLKDDAMPATDFLDNGKRDAFAVSQADGDLEDCDFGGNDSGREFILERIDATLNRCTHRINLGRNEPLFSVTLQAGDAPVLALRHDVDVCVWQMPKRCTGAEDDTWRPTHQGTLDALGYVQASKTQKRFIRCAPNFEYSIIAETQRHVFIYKSQYGSAGALKNRHGKPVSVGQQKLFATDGKDEICGMVVDNEVTVLLTDNDVICVQVNA